MGRRIHRVDRYARDVLDGRIVAGPYVRLACRRHVQDRATGGRRGLAFDADRADHAIRFIETWVHLPDTLDADGTPARFVLQPWQAFIVGSLFGWVDAKTGYRRFKFAFCEVGKGNGKTPLVAAIGLYGLTMDGNPSAQIYAAAADRDQAMILFRDAVRMVDASPELAKRVQKSGISNVHNLSYGHAFFRPFSREQGARSGTRPHFGLIDEVHEHPTPEAIVKIRAGAKGDPEALFIEITNSGFDRTSICWEHHEQAIRIVEGGDVEEGDRTFAYVCALDEGDDPLTDRACHVKANPNLGVSIHQTYLDDQVRSARTIAAETNTVLRLNFCVWTHAIARAWAMDVWRRTGLERVDPEQLIARPCTGGLDLGMTDDFTAWVRVWDLEDGRVAVLPRFWIPRAALTRYPNRPYDAWLRVGVLDVTEGDTTDYDVVEAVVLADARASGCREIAYDKRFAAQLALHLQGAGLTMVDTAQGFGLNEAIRSVQKLVADGAVVHGNHPILGWMMDNAVLRTGRNGEVRIDKDEAREKIDGAVAFVMAEDRRIHRPPPRETFQFFVLGGAT